MSACSQASLSSSPLLEYQIQESSKRESKLFNFSGRSLWDSYVFTDTNKYNVGDNYTFRVIALSQRFFSHLVKKPKLLEKRINSVSVISQDSHATFLQIQMGVIVSFPSACLFATAKTDMCTKNIFITNKLTSAEKKKHTTLMLNELQRLNTFWGISGPDALLKPVPFNWNEVVVIGDTKLLGEKEPSIEKKIAIEGIYIKVSPKLWAQLTDEKKFYEGRQQNPLKMLLRLPSPKLTKELQKHGIIFANNSLRSHYATALKLAHKLSIKVIFLPDL